jgi:DNA/RNA-binding domain of Phe-tRNA-synthetase-like protein
MINISPKWETTYPGAALGILSMRNAYSVQQSPALESKKTALEEKIRLQYRNVERQEILESTVMAAYVAYYKRFRKTYHLLLQLESVAKKNKSIPQTIPLVQAVFMAEMNSFLLTAGHDLDKVLKPIKLDIADGTESYPSLRGEKVICKSGDMIMSDSQGVICSIIRGQDQRSMITKVTDSVLYVVYAPPGIPTISIEDHLLELAENVTLVSPQAEIEFQHIYHAGPPPIK